jgi:hypothetical protein
MWRLLFTVESFRPPGYGWKLFRSGQMKAKNVSKNKAEKSDVPVDIFVWRSAKPGQGVSQILSHK